MKNVFFLLVCLTLMISCTKNPNENLDQLIGKYHGKYELISSFSTDSVDINQDGFSSTDLITENSEISNSELEIRIRKEHDQSFEEKWPVEGISQDILWMYASYINYFQCEIDQLNKSIKLLSGIPPVPEFTVSSNTLISIESIIIEENEIIKVTAIRKLYTINGWITTTTISRYKRYTTIT